MKYYLGIDVGGTNCKIGLVDETGVVHLKDEYSVNYDNYQTPMLESVASAVSQFMPKISQTISGIAVSATGQIDSYKGEVIGTCGNLPNYIGTNFKNYFETTYHLPTTVINDANCMVLAEKWLGAGRNYHNIVGMTIGTGVGGGIIVDDRILLGTKGLAGELGHMIVDESGPTCTCGANGCFERLSATSYLVKNAQAIDNSVTNGRLLFSKINDGDLRFDDLINKWIKDTSTAIASLIHIFNPDCVIIGGGMASQQIIIEPLKSAILSKVMPRFTDNLVIINAELENDAGFIGAVYHHIQIKENL